MKADSKTEQAVTNVLKAWANSYAKRDLNGFLSAFVEDEDVVLIGTGADEMRVGPAQLEIQAKRDWAQTEAIAITFDHIAVSARGDVAWATTDGAFEAKVGGEQMRLPARATFVLEKRDNDWRVVQAHFSSPMVDQEEGHSIPGH